MGVEISWGLTAVLAASSAAAASSASAAAVAEAGPAPRLGSTSESERPIPESASGRCPDFLAVKRGRRMACGRDPFKVFCPSQMPHSICSIRAGRPDGLHPIAALASR